MVGGGVTWGRIRMQDVLGPGTQGVISSGLGDQEKHGDSVGGRK
jgi:hypothetical protein